MDAKLINPFVDAFTTVMPMLGFPEPTRTKLYAASNRVKSLGVSMLVGFTKQIRGNVVYNMGEDTAKFIASQMMMGMPVETFDEMAQSAISELSNMLTAHTATNITGLGLDVDISTPSLSVGKDFDVKISDGQYLVVEMNLNGQLVDLAIAVDQN
ncbi:MAG: chemotaxis protein CheX [Centipeda sp. (in: firmicutes)]